MNKQNPKPPKHGFLTEATEGSFNGHPVIKLYRDAEDKFPFTMGVRKVELVLKHLEAIKAFAAKHAETTEV